MYSFDLPVKVNLPRCSTRDRTPCDADAVGGSRFLCKDGASFSISPEPTTILRHLAEVVNGAIDGSFGGPLACRGEGRERCARHDSNMRPLPPQGSALSPELRARDGQCSRASVPPISSTASSGTSRRT